jgi:hypothetical protein
MSRFLQHILPRGFARVRTFGWLHPAAKVRANRVRALLRQQPLLTPAEKDTWQPPADPEDQPPPLPQLLGAAKRSEDGSTKNPLARRLATPECNEGGSTAKTAQPTLCPRCQKVMLLAGSWRPGQPMLYPKRPP